MKTSTRGSIRTRLRTHEVISHEEYLRRLQSDPASVRGAQPISPGLGRGFGGFRVRLKHPKYEPTFQDLM